MKLPRCQSRQREKKGSNFFGAHKSSHFLSSSFHTGVNTKTQAAHTHCCSHSHHTPGVLLLVIHAYMSISGFSPEIKSTAVLQKSKQFAQGYLDRPSIHSWELKVPGGFIMRRLLILGFPLEMLDEFHFI